MSKSTEYQIVRKGEPDQLEQSVIGYIKDGWEPLGGVAFASEDDCYCQAMIRVPAPFVPGAPRQIPKRP